MGAIAGVFARRGGALQEPLLDRLSASLRRVGPDAAYRRVSGPVGVIHRPFYTDADSRRTAEPYVTGEGSVVLWDGRLDNIPELTRELSVSSPGSPFLVLAAHRRWGSAGFGRLVGDFVFALWDAHEHTLTLCADPLGRRPLYYRLTDEWCVWSSSCRSLVRALQLSAAPDDDYVADYLSNRPSSSAPFRDISFLPGGHVLRVDPQKAVVYRYWSLDPTREIVYGSDAEYEAHFRDLFQRVVADSLNSEGPVFCELSGGVDSSSIACVADRLAREGRCVAPAVRTVSYLFDHSASADERHYVAIAEMHLTRSGLHLSENDCPVLTMPDAQVIEPETPTSQLWFLARQDHLARVMEQEGARVILSGIGGDQLFLSEHVPEVLPLADLLVERRLAELFRSARDWSRLLGWPLVKTVWLSGCCPVIPRRWYAMWQRHNPLPDWLDPGFVKRTSLRDRLLGMPDDCGVRLPSRRYQYCALRQSMRPFALDKCLTEACVEVRYPYLDRRLVEFALALPLNQKVRVGETRSIVRRAFRGELPEPILQRRTKAGPAEAFCRALIRQWPQWSAWLSEPRVCAHGFADRARFADALRRARHGVVDNCAQLARIVSLEIWLRSLRARDSDDIRSRAA